VSASPRVKFIARALKDCGVLADSTGVNNVRRDERLLAIIRTQTEIAASDLDLLATMQLIAERSQELTRASGAVIEIVEGDEMVYEVTTGDATPYLGMKLKQEASLSGLCVAEGRLLRCDDTRDDPRVDAEACRRVNAAAMICVPLEHRREVVGVLKVYSGVAHNFSDDDVEALELLTDLIAAHISHATDFEMKAHDSRHDALTGLANRRSYQERLAVEINRANRYGHPLSICLLDLDGFKEVNDRLGHPAGDEVLRAVAREIDQSRVADDAFRIGGDEFAILMPETTPAEAQLAAERLAEAIVEVNLGEAAVGVSYGIALGFGDPELAHAAADAQLLAAKDRLYGRPPNEG
jgi:diguanylate cyclase (GGDEF)-like protein